jgi:hypothetical protein
MGLTHMSTRRRICPPGVVYVECAAAAATGGYKGTEGSARKSDSPRELEGRDTGCGLSSGGEGVCVGVPMLEPVEDGDALLSSDMVGGGWCRVVV